MNIIIDTDALLGLFDEEDAHFAKSTSFAQKLIARRVNTFLLPTTLGEFVTLGTIRIGRARTQGAIQAIQRLQFLSLDITETLTNNALALYLRQTSKEESLFDCYVMIAAKEIKADAIFSFDKGYQKNGFKLVSDIV